jgi:DNA-directed RNA polymerase specialized sigma24 family protein
VAIAQFQHGDASGLNQLLARQEHYHRLLDIARARLGRKAPHLKSVIDAEDVVGSAMGSFLRGAKAGKFPHLQHQNELLGLLVTILVRKVAHKIRDLARRGDGKVEPLPEAVFEAEGREPSSETVAIAEEMLREWHSHLRGKDAQLPDVADLLVWQGYGAREIADELGLKFHRTRRLLTMARKETEVFLQEQKDDD